ncbi:hypothetical protein SADUNF_Sadunf01G0072300 [Salix dunnii]|uniref:Uncharacterized protein n=1 Tax=Salix dunnii TaxID=1413687 RepID=A0A835TJE5_9ROSI|nr:hypothetical protein SADUNF_Sadunf01G0072300 [Salix dunnii]
MASMQCIKPDEKACDQEQERMVCIQEEQTLSHEKAVSETQSSFQTNGPHSQAQVDQTKNLAPVAVIGHEKKKIKGKKENKDKKEKNEKKEKKDKKEKQKKEKKGDGKKKEKSGDKTK